MHILSYRIEEEMVPLAAVVARLTDAKTSPNLQKVWLVRGNHPGIARITVARDRGYSSALKTPFINFLCKITLSDRPKGSIR